MPTTTKLVAAVLTGIIGFLAASLAITYLQEGGSPGMVQPVSAVIGFLVGWFYTGPRVELTPQKALGTGFVGSVLLLFWVLLAFAGYEMLQRAFKVQYDGPVKALQDVVSVSVDYLGELVQLDVLLLLAVGGVMIGAIARWTARHYR